MVLATIEIPQLRVDRVVDAPFYAGRADYSCRGAEADSHGPGCSADHRDSPVAVHGGRCPVAQVVQDIPVGTPRLIPMVSLAMDIPQFFFDKVFDVPHCVALQILRCCCGEDIRAPTVAAR